MQGQKVLITLNDQGGAVMNWNYNELAATLRAEMSSHPPVVVVNGIVRSNSRPSDTENQAKR